MSQVFILPLHASANEVAGANGALVAFPPKEAIFTLDVTAAAGTTPTLDVTIEEYDPVTGKYAVIETFAQKVTTGSERKLLAVQFLGNIRCVWAIGGTASPNFTFSVSAGGKC